jgi:hypothetical protein
MPLKAPTDASSFVDDDRPETVVGKRKRKPPRKRKPARKKGKVEEPEELEVPELILLHYVPQIEGEPVITIKIPGPSMFEDYLNPLRQSIMHSFTTMSQTLFVMRMQ